METTPFIDQSVDNCTSVGCIQNGNLQSTLFFVARFQLANSRKKGQKWEQMACVGDEKEFVRVRECERKREKEREQEKTKEYPRSEHKRNLKQIIRSRIHQLQTIENCKFFHQSIHATTNSS